MQFKFAGAVPVASGWCKTSEDRERSIREEISKKFPRRINRLGKAEALLVMKFDTVPTIRTFFEKLIVFIRELFSDTESVVVMRAANQPYMWRVYHVSDPDVLLYGTCVDECRAFVAHGFTISVVSMGARLCGGDSVHEPIERTYEQYVKYHSRGKLAWNAWLERQALRAQVY